MKISLTSFTSEDIADVIPLFFTQNKDTFGDDFHLFFLFSKHSYLWNKKKITRWLEHISCYFFHPKINFICSLPLCNILYLYEFASYKSQYISIKLEARWNLWLTKEFPTTKATPSGSLTSWALIGLNSMCFACSAKFTWSAAIVTRWSYS